MNRLRKQLNLLLVVKLDSEDFVELVFMCKFDLAKMMNRFLDTEMDKATEVFVKNLDPALLFLRKHNLDRKFKRDLKLKNHMSKFREMHDLKSNYSGSSSRRGSFRVERSKTNSPRRDSTIVMQKLGPLSHYLYLLDPELELERQTPRIEIPGFDFNLDDLQTLDDILRKCEGIINIDPDSLGSGSVQNLDELIRNLNSLYERLELNNQSIL